ncbi:RND efflux system, inner membrane transporter CmeB [Anopheles sinensis]|uniref:RND efflux system, inner membrane transporter CmeB n=1 Tax=Anopheles sinensis TaxID=74873 RepID=A0A084WET1_ANOSI|nr:RND efflux system, inner membrane transporter CmeB [Anopheles sinensis]
MPLSVDVFPTIAPPITGATYQAGGAHKDETMRGAYNPSRRTMHGGGAEKWSDVLAAVSTFDIIAADRNHR